MANEKDMNPMSGDTVETDGVYQDESGHEVELRAGDEYPMDPQLGKVEYKMVGLVDTTLGMNTDEREAAQSHVPLSGVTAENPESREARQLKHRKRGGDH